MCTSKTMSITTNTNGIMNTNISIWDFIIFSAYNTDASAYIIIPFAVGNSWWIKAIVNQSTNAVVVNTTMNIRLYGKMIN